ncbi:hypothetical protein RB1180 [Rhodopirellula baltica SH 1]|uniref:Uncharacterized protein n=1 Tax=Rhodopirellula baltica (strain DSM 10527 / NCIMB 13988 / SH1) TaxID=243090 RepID=Q7UXQ8_RHOBA|nr:hypothetical protein RB1180 [Rhodopirellula baltica SH 1]
MLAVWRKPPGEKPEGSRVSATSLVVHVVPSKASQHRRSGPLLVKVVPVTTRRVGKASQHLLLLPIKHKILPERSNATRGNASTSATKTVSRA